MNTKQHKEILESFSSTELAKTLREKGNRLSYKERQELLQNARELIYSK